MWKSYNDYASFLWWVNKNKTAIDKHHIIPLQTYWPDLKENIADVLQTDHKIIHNTLDISWRYFSTLIRKQRKKENWNIVLTENDIDGRREIQNLYFEDAHKLPIHLKEMHDVKTWELLEKEAFKFKRLTWEEYPIEIWETLDNILIYNDIQKEISKEIYKKLRK